jgi:superfamily I DNA and/or RNA helicase/very-short-patch-repair endonuclease
MRIDQMMISLISCSYCGFNLPDQAKFCHDCGKPIEKTVMESGVLTESPGPPLKFSSVAAGQPSLNRKLEYYRDRLLKIDLGNRSILLRSIRDLWCFDLSGISPTKNIIEHAILDRKGVCIISNSDKSHSAEKERMRLRKLYRNTIDIQRQTGRQEMYLGFPFLVGHVNKQLYVRGPLILFPVSIVYRQEGKPAGWYILFSEDKDPILNRALMQRIRIGGGQTLQYSFEEEFENLLDKLEERKAKSNHGLEQLFLNELVNILQEHKFPIDYNRRLDNIQVLNKISVSGAKVSVDDKISWIENEVLHLVNHKVIGNFPQGENAIYLDYEELIREAKTGKQDFGIIEKLLPDEPTSDTNLADDKGTEKKEFENIMLDDVPIDKLSTVIASDASQDNAVLAAQSSGCVIVSGPPGTGKSQMIVNLISNALSKGQKVLLVCQKREALEVVYRRLDKVGLSRYVAPLYDGKDRSSIYKKLSSVLGSDLDSSNISLINQKFSHSSQEIDRIVEQQSRIVNALKDEDLVGVSVTKLYTWSKPGYVAKLDLADLAQEIKFYTLPHLLDIIHRLEGGCKKFDSPQSPWYSRKDFSNLSFSDRDNIIKTINAILANLAKNKDALLTESISDQKALIESLDILAADSGSGLFRRLLSGGKERTARDRVKTLLRQSHLPEGISGLTELSRRATAGLQIWDDFNNFLSFLNQEGSKTFSKELSEYRHDMLHSKLTAMRESLVDFDEFQSHDRRKSELSSKERKILQLCIDKLSLESGWDEILKQELYLHWIEYIESKHPDLKGQPFETYLFNRDRLSELIKSHRTIVINRILNRINDSIVSPNITLKASSSYKARYDQWTILLDELNKRRHVMPMKKLVELYQSILLRIAPCWLATPSAVSSIFPLKRNIFDYVIFDEASQSFVAHSLTSLYRGKNIVIIGDEKQLPPVDHFRSLDDEENAETEINRVLLSDSLLSLATRAFSYTYLTWHYRSNFQELIDFSNHAFYEGSLKVAPNVSTSSVPIRWVICPKGSWVNQRNKPEAVLAVDELRNILTKNKLNGQSRSVGIITFNFPQQEEIKDEIDRRIQNDPEFRELYFIADDEKRGNANLPFIRNIEKVQGDERDIIIFSLGYAKNLANPDDTIKVRFGSLNQRDGEKYLNVAITRARQEIVIVCSFDPYRIDADGAEHDGPRRLKDYLCYAKSLDKTDRQETQSILSSLHSSHSETGAAFTLSVGEDSLEQLIKNDLEGLGYKVNPQVGHSNYKIDLAIVHPDNPSRYILAIECDGKSFQSAQSTIERDITRQEFLASKGWVVEQIWSRNWWRDSKKEINRIQQKIEELRKNEIIDNYTKLSQDDQLHKEQPTLIVPGKPFSNKVLMWDAINLCDEYIYWFDKYFSTAGFRLLTQVLVDNNKVKKIKILTSPISLISLPKNDQFKTLFKDFRQEMNNNGFECELRVITNPKIYSNIHDRWIMSKNICFNVPSTDVVERGQYSEVIKTDTKPPFGIWWDSALDLMIDWNKVNEAADEIRNKKKPL